MKLGNERTGERTVYLQFFGQQVGNNDGETWKQGCQENTNIANINGDMKPSQAMIDRRWGDHQSRVDRSTNDTSQRVPGSVIEPIVERVEPFVRQELRRTIVEVRIELMNHRFIA